VPSLRDRKEDIILLFRKFCVDFAEKYKTSPVQLDDDAKQALLKYTWPGNVRELKNIAEQVSVLAKDKQVNAPELRKFLPENRANNMLPVLASQTNGHPHTDFGSERDIMYKLFFDMKKDVTELKKMFFEVIHNPSAAPAVAAYARESLMHDFTSVKEIEPPAMQQQAQPMIYNGEDIHEHIEVEESLNIMDKEKTYRKALKKYKEKEDAASDLASVKGLYRN
jgi:DNA-binding NtrC family response regulator